MAGRLPQDGVSHSDRTFVQQLLAKTAQTGSRELRMAYIDFGDLVCNVLSVDPGETKARGRDGQRRLAWDNYIKRASCCSSGKLA